MSRKTSTIRARCTDETVAQARELGRLWGPVAPLSQGEVIVECVRRAYAQEIASKKVKRSERGT